MASRNCLSNQMSLCLLSPSLWYLCCSWDDDDLCRSWGSGQMNQLDRMRSLEQIKMFLHVSQTPPASIRINSNSNPLPQLPLDDGYGTCLICNQKRKFVSATACPLSMSQSARPTPTQSACLPPSVLLSVSLSMLLSVSGSFALTMSAFPFVYIVVVIRVVAVCLCKWTTFLSLLCCIAGALAFAYCACPAGHGGKGSGNFAIDCEPGAHRNGKRAELQVKTHFWPIFMFVICLFTCSKLCRAGKPSHSLSLGVDRGCASLSRDHLKVLMKSLQ